MTLDVGVDRLHRHGLVVGGYYIGPVVFARIREGHDRRCVRRNIHAVIKTCLCYVVSAFYALTFGLLGLIPVPRASRK